MLVKMEKKGKDVMWRNMVSYTWNLCSAFNPSQCTHTAVSSEHTHTHTHTMNTHPEQWAANAAASGALLKGLISVVVLKVERALDIHSPNLQSPPDLRLEPSGYKSDSLTIRPRLSPQHPLKPKAQKLFKIHLYIHLIMILWNFIQLPSLKINILLNI